MLIFSDSSLKITSCIGEERPTDATEALDESLQLLCTMQFQRNEVNTVVSYSTVSAKFHCLSSSSSFVIPVCIQSRYTCNFISLKTH